MTCYTIVIVLRPLLYTIHQLLVCQVYFPLMIQSFDQIYLDDRHLKTKGNIICAVLRSNLINSIDSCKLHWPWHL